MSGSCDQGRNLVDCYFPAGLCLQQILGWRKLFLNTLYLAMVVLHYVSYPIITL